MSGNVTLRFQIPLPPKVILPIEDKLRRKIEALNFHPGEKVRIRPADRLLYDEPNGEAELAYRSTLIDRDLTIETTWVEIHDNNTYRVRHGFLGHEGRVSAAALSEAGNVEIGYGVVFKRDGQAMACLFDECHPAEAAPEDIKFKREPIPIAGFERAFLYLCEDSDSPGSFAKGLLDAPVTGEFSLRIAENGTCSVVAAPWTSGLGDNESVALKNYFASAGKAITSPLEESPSP